MSKPLAALAQALAFHLPAGRVDADLSPTDNFLCALADGHTPTWREVVEIVAQLGAQAKAKTLCAERDCPSYDRTRGTCPCSQDPDALAAQSLLAASFYAKNAHRAHERRALQLQQNDVTAQAGGWVS